MEVFDFERDLQRHEQAREDKEMTEDYSSGQRITDRPDDPRKQAFIDRFLAEERIDAYPFLERDLVAENFGATTAAQPDLPDNVSDWPEEARDVFEERAAIQEHMGGLSRVEAERAAEEHVRSCWRAGTIVASDVRGRVALNFALREAVTRAYVHCDWTGGPTPTAVATDLLASSSSNRLLRIGALPFELISVELVLAHLQTLGFNFPPRLAATIARRATILLLNARHMS